VNPAVKPHIASVAVASPPFAIGQAEAGEFLERHYKDRLSPRMQALMRKVFAHPSIKQRNFAVDGPWSLLDENPDERIARFTRCALDLSEEAARKALLEAGLGVEDISALVVNTCTGYICPGISTYLIERLGLSPRTRAFDLVGSGCGGAAPNIQTSASMLKGPEDAVLSVSVEICSATFQMDDDLSLIVSNALFADGAAAAVLCARPQGFEVLDNSCIYVPEQREAIRYVHKGGQLHNQLSTSLPHMVKKAVSRTVSDVLAPRSLGVGDIRHWALHTGGEKILNYIRDELGLTEDQLGPARDILMRYGNMSSPTALFVLREIMEGGVEEGQWCVMAVFGAGLSAHSLLLRTAGPI
jgi:alkylresorcinol/alkylpyrone synthase